MRFGQRLQQYQVFEWAPYYIDYQALKQLYKNAIGGEDADWTDFTASLDRNLSKTRSFYKRKHNLLQQHAKNLLEDYGLSTFTDLDYASEPTIIDIKAAFIELRSSLKRLLWFWVVNFDKIIGTLAKFKEDITFTDNDLDLRDKSVEELSIVNEWLDRIQSKDGDDSDSKTKSTLPEERVAGSRSYLLPVETSFAAIEQDDVISLDQQLERHSKIAEDDRTQCGLLFTLLRYSIVRGAQGCTARLLVDIEHLEEYIGYIHELICTIGRARKLKDRPLKTHHSTDDLLAWVVAKLGRKLGKPLETTNSFGRTLLHHAVRYDLPQLCQAILKDTEAIREPYGTAAYQPACIPDSEGLTSLDIAVLDTNVPIVETLIEDHQNRMEAAGFDGRNPSCETVLPGRLLAYALELKAFPIVRMLSGSVIDFQHKDHSGNTALHLAVQTREEEYVIEILQACEDIDLNAREDVHGWTPLMVASANGDQPIVQLLLQAGVDLKSRDHSGWSAKDHAAYRGRLSTAKSLAALTPKQSGNDSAARKDHQRRRPAANKHASVNRTESQNQQVLPSKSLIFVNLGALETYKPVTAVDLGHYVWPDRYDLQRESDFRVEIGAAHESQAQISVQLPIMENLANKPYRFTMDDPRNFKLAFKIYPSETSGHDAGSLIGSAVALLADLKQGLGPTRESLIRNFTIPILQKDTLDFIGTVTFYFQIVTPFPHPDPKQVIKQKLLFPSSKDLRIIGHRGTGQNDPGRRQLQIGENTIESFVAAKDHGASYVEFDVQLTKDHVPVIYHDFLMSETGIDAPLHHLNLEQFMYMSDAQTSNEEPLSTTLRRSARLDDDGAEQRPKQRSRSLDSYNQANAKALIDRMKHTFEYKVNQHRGCNSYKGNVRSEFIQAPFATLEDLLTKLPESIGFDVEIKYPMLYEAHGWGMETSAPEINHLVDSILDRTYRLAGNRKIIFSSFSPEICILLSKKQDIYPVFFLTEADHIPSSDARADSLQEAVDFARSWQLAGIICKAEPLVMSPHLVKYVKDAGLRCISWGGMNDDVECVKTQVEAGIDAIITDSVKLISQTLNGE